MPAGCGSSSRRSLAVFGAVLALLPPAAATSAAPTVCRRDEVTLFRCQTADEHVVAVCASRGFSARQGHLEYRYGTLDHAEIVLPPSGTAPADGAALGSVMEPRATGAGLRFSFGAYRYLVYSVAGGERGPKAGIGIYRGDEQVAHHRCRGQPDVPVQTRLLQQAGFVYEDAAFDLPQ